MKNLFFVFILALASLLSCSKDDNNNEPSEKIFMSYKVNGSLVELKGTTANASAIVDALGSVTIVSIQQGGNSLSIKLKSNQIGKYILGDLFSDNSASYLTLSKGFFTLENNVGIVEITTTSNTNLKGTFYFNAFDEETNTKVVITEGKFDVPVQK